MALKARWTEEAENTFDAIIEYLEKEWSDKEIRSFVRKTHIVIEQIEKSPFQFRASSIHKIRKAVITKHNSLLYGVDEEKGIIELYTFWDNRKNPSKLPY